MNKIDLILIGSWIFQLIIAFLLYHLRKTDRFESGILEEILTIVNLYFIIAIPVGRVFYSVLHLNILLALVFFLLLTCLIMLSTMPIYLDDNGSSDDSDTKRYKRYLIIFWILYICTVIGIAIYHCSIEDYFYREVVKEEKFELLYFNELPVTEDYFPADMITLGIEQKKSDDTQEDEIVYWYFDEEGNIQKDSIEKEELKFEFFKEDSSKSPYFNVVVTKKELVRVKETTGKETVVHEIIEKEEHCFYLPETFKSYVFLESKYSFL